MFINSLAPSIARSCTRHVISSNLARTNMQTRYSLMNSSQTSLKGIFKKYNLSNFLKSDDAQFIKGGIFLGYMGLSCLAGGMAGIDEGERIAVNWAIPGNNFGNRIRSLSFKLIGGCVGFVGGPILVPYHIIKPLLIGK